MPSTILYLLLSLCLWLNTHGFASSVSVALSPPPNPPPNPCVYPQSTRSTILPTDDMQEEALSFCYRHWLNSDNCASTLLHFFRETHDYSPLPEGSLEPHGYLPFKRKVEAVELSLDISRPPVSFMFDGKPQTLEWNEDVLDVSQQLCFASSEDCVSNLVAKLGAAQAELCGHFSEAAVTIAPNLPTPDASLLHSVQSHDETTDCMGVFIDLGSHEGDSLRKFVDGLNGEKLDELGGLRKKVNEVVGEGIDKYCLFGFEPNFERFRSRLEKTFVDLSNASDSRNER